MNFAGGLRIDFNFCEFRPLALFVYPQDRTGLNFSQRKAPSDPLAVFAQFDLAFQVPTIVVRTHSVCFRFIVVRNDPKRLKSDFAIQFGPPYTLNGKD